LDTIIHVDGVSKRFGKVRAVHDLYFDVRRGDVVGFIGPNGAGKTTTIRMLSAVLRPDSGVISVNGFDAATQGDEVRASIGVMTEGAGLYPNLSGLDNLKFFAELHGVDDPERPASLLKAMGLSDAARRRAGTYSTGMKKRLGLAKALIHRPPVLLLDEPTSGLDPEGITMVLDEVRRLAREEGVTVMLCSHILHQLEAVCDRYVIVEAGRLLAQGSLEELVNEYITERVLELVTDLTEEKASQIADRSSARLVSFVSGRVCFAVGRADEVPPLIAAVSATARIWSAVRVGEDLQSAYFRVMEAKASEA
jgi:ABC-2 type transport system ATP-binding protein